MYCCRVKLMAEYRGGNLINNILPNFNMWREKKIILVITKTVLEKLPPKELLNSTEQFENYRLISWSFPFSLPPNCLKSVFLLITSNSTKLGPCQNSDPALFLQKFRF